mmetsp:Transcript_59325/g.64042  ORF Transcript_59325/g.64042 Transcript_59325/m.64042 type:complete len:106 (+) Transcript_59325:80-397(+)
MYERIVAYTNNSLCSRRLPTLVSIYIIIECMTYIIIIMCIVNKPTTPYALHSAMMAHSIADTITIGSQSGGGGGGYTSTRSSSCSSRHSLSFSQALRQQQTRNGW